APGARLQVWTDQLGGERITDLTDIDGQPITEVVVSDGTDGWQLGAIRPFRAPYTRVWIGVEGQPRVLSVTHDLPDLTEQAAADPHPGYLTPARGDERYVRRQLTTDPLPEGETLRRITLTSQPSATDGNLHEVWVIHQGQPRMVRWDNERGLYRAEQQPGAL